MIRTGIHIGFLLAIVLSFLPDAISVPVMVNVESPDKKLKCIVSTDNDQISISVTMNGKVILEPSPLRLSLDGIEITNGIKGGKSKSFSANMTYPTWGLHSIARDYHNGVTAAFHHIKSGTKYSLEVKVFNDAVAFRFIVPGKKNYLKKANESTVFRLPSGSETWSHKQNISNERVYKKYLVDTIPEGQWVVSPIMNAFIYSPERNQSNITEIKGTITTPWRVIMAGSDLNTIVNSDVMQNLERTWPNTLRYKYVKVMEDRNKNTTWVHQIAQAAIYSAPVKTFTVTPDHLTDNQGVEMIKSIPEVWDETIVLPPSEIGEMVVYSQRKGTTWFLSVLNGQEPQSVKIPLSFLDKDEYNTVVLHDDEDNPTSAIVINSTANQKDTVNINLGPGGGFISRFTVK